MSQDQLLSGGCSCGRNQYAISIPQSIGGQAEVYFDVSDNNRRAQAAPLTAWLRVPLTWYQSYTRSFFPDETHNAIRRTFVPSNDPNSRRNFCGFCGTQLTFWTESSPAEAEYMSVTVGSLDSQDQAALEDLDLLPKDPDVEAVVNRTPGSQVQASSSTGRDEGNNTPNLSVTHRTTFAGGIPWFEEMIEGSRLGQYGRRHRAVGGTADSSVHIEWETSEWHSTQPGSDEQPGGLLAPEFGGSPAKRKSPEVGYRPSRLTLWSLPPVTTLRG